MTAPKKKVKRKVFRFVKDSPIVTSWVNMIIAGVYTLEEVPDALNLVEVVTERLAELGYKEVEEAPAAPAPAEPAPAAPEATPASAAETPAPAEPAPAEPVHYIDPVA